ncbi:MAG TPA: GNAT family N-acetyltransferase [Thermoplasmata archaeon]|nr:GNAT family N-acetyltransferase [Thermoplasmata archaeon]
MTPTDEARPPVLPTIRPLPSPAEIERLAIGDLSDWFNPFLPHFMRECLRSGGEIHVAADGPAVSGLLLYDPVDRTASVFARSPEIALELFRHRDHGAVFSEHPFPLPRVRFDILSVDLSGWDERHRFAHPVRAVREGDVRPIADLMREVYGRFDERWLGNGAPEGEKGFVSMVDGQVAGTAWVTLVPGFGRLHSLSVRPRFRRLGLGTDLVYARMLWAARNGARRVISEIPEDNAASLEIARRAGMRRSGSIYLYERP